MNGVDTQKLYAKMVVNGNDIQFQSTFCVLDSTKKVCGNPDLESLAMVLRCTNLERRGLVCVTLTSIESTILNLRMLVKKRSSRYTVIQEMQFVTFNSRNILTVEGSGHLEAIKRLRQTFAGYFLPNNYFSIKLK